MKGLVLDVTDYCSTHKTVNSADIEDFDCTACFESSLKWTVLGHSERSEGVKVDGLVSKWTNQKGLKWTVCRPRPSTLAQMTVHFLDGQSTFAGPSGLAD